MRRLLTYSLGSLTPRREKAWIFGIFVLTLLLSYSGIILYHLSAPPGDDAYIHLANTYFISKNGLQAFGQGYPYGFYLVVIGLSKITHLSLLQSITYLAPLLLPLSGLAIWALARSQFERQIALLAYLLYALVSRQPLQTYFDGSFPNLLAASVILPLFFLVLLKAVQEKQKLGWGVGVVLLTAALLFTHHLTVLIYLTVTIIWAVLWCLRAVIQARRTSFLLIALVVMIALLGGVGWAFLHLSIFAPARGVFTTYVTVSSNFPFLSRNKLLGEQPLTLLTLGQSVGGLIVEGGALGLLLLFQPKLSSRQRGAALLLAIWFSVYFISALTPLSGEPTRLARDLAMPGSILAAWFIIWLYRAASTIHQAVALVLVGVIAAVSLAAFYQKGLIFTSYSSMVRFSAADQQAYQYLIDTHLAPQTTVLIQDISWPIIADAEGGKEQFAQIEEQVPYKEVGITPCYLVGWYVGGVWPSSFADPTKAETYLAQPNLTIRQSFTDPNKVWYLLCRTS